MGRPVWFVHFLQLFFPYRNHLAKIAKLPGVKKFINEIFFDGDRMYYLPKEKVVIREQIDTDSNFCMPSQVVHHFIEQAHYFFIMDNCICRQADHCQNYPIEIGCLFLGKPVLQINSKFGRLVTREEAHIHEKTARNAGLIHLIGRYKIDSIWLGTGPAEELVTICNCCPCCCFATAIPALEPDIDIRVKKMPGVELKVNNQCIGCGKCTEGICFINAIKLVDGKASISSVCRGCGRCVEFCDQNAIEIDVSSNSASLTISELKQLFKNGR